MDEGESVALTLGAFDNDHSPEELTISVTTLPTHGRLFQYLPSGSAGAEITAGNPVVHDLEGRVFYIPNDVSLIFGESNFLLVTGPNMGGKVSSS